MVSGSLFNRSMAAGFDWWRLNGQIAETMIASQAVIATRMTMIGKGMGQPGQLPTAEMARMLPEKMAAFGRAGSDAAQHVFPTDPAAWTGSFDAGLQMFEMWERSLAASLAWWKPLHAESTANARRLARRRR
jgi:hypothetical protein